MRLPESTTAGQKGEGFPGREGRPRPVSEAAFVQRERGFREAGQGGSAERAQAAQAEGPDCFHWVSQTSHTSLCIPVG